MGKGKRMRMRMREAMLEGEKKKLYLFVWHGGRTKYVNSLYALDIPDPDDSTPIPVTKTTTTTTVTEVIPSEGEKPISTTVVSHEEPIRVSIEPVLRFNYEDWPQRMTCVYLNSRFYFLGGVFGCHQLGDLEYRREVFSLDPRLLPWSSSLRDNPLAGMLKSRVSIMHSGKIAPISFVDGGRIFVLSGKDKCPFTGKKLVQFEYSCTKVDKWYKADPPPFSDVDFLGPYVIVGRLFIIATHASQIYSYHLDFNFWSPYDTSSWTKLDDYPCFYFEEGSQYIGGTIYSTFCTSVPVIIPLRSDGKQLDEDKYFDVIKYIIPSYHGLSSTLVRTGRRHLCFVQAGYLSQKEGTGISVTQFKVSENGDSAQHLNSAHYVTPNHSAFDVHAAYVVKKACWAATLSMLQSEGRIAGESSVVEGSEGRIAGESSVVEGSTFDL